MTLSCNHGHEQHYCAGLVFHLLPGVWVRLVLETMVEMEKLHLAFHFHDYSWGHHHSTSQQQDVFSTSMYTPGIIFPSYVLDGLGTI